MSLKDIQTIKLNTYTTQEGEVKVRDAVIKNVRLNWVFLETPRAADTPGAKPRYDAQVIIENEEVLNTLSEYFNIMYEDAVAKKWQGRRPNINNMNTPFRSPSMETDENGNQVLDENGQPKRAIFEEHALAVLTVSNNSQPKLFMRKNGEQLRAADEGDDGEFYSGMIGEVHIAFYAYAKGLSPKDGIKVFINAVCKTDDGNPIFKQFGTTDYNELFGGEETEGFYESFKAEPAAPAQAAPVQPKTGVPVTPTQTAPNPILQGLMKQTGKKVEVTQTAEPAKTTLQDLIKR